MFIIKYLKNLISGLTDAALCVCYALAGRSFIDWYAVKVTRGTLEYVAENPSENLQAAIAGCDRVNV